MVTDEVEAEDWPLWEDTKRWPLPPPKFVFLVEAAQRLLDASANQAGAWRRAIADDRTFRWLHQLFAEGRIRTRYFDEGDGDIHPIGAWGRDMGTFRGVLRYGYYSPTLTEKGHLAAELTGVDLAGWVFALRCDVEQAEREAAEIWRVAVNSTGQATGGADASAVVPDLSAALIGTGDPGRPEKGATLYLAEFARRSAAGVVEKQLAKEARQLLAWFIGNHPDRQAPTVGTIQNRIRDDWNRYNTAYEKPHENKD